MTTGWNLNTSSVVHLRSSPLPIPDPFSEPFPCPFNTMDFGHSTARRFAGYSCKSPAKVHSLSETPSSFIQHVKELSSFLNLSVSLQDTRYTSYCTICKNAYLISLTKMGTFHCLQGSVFPKSYPMVSFFQPYFSPSILVT